MISIVRSGVPGRRKGSDLPLPPHLMGNGGIVPASSLTSQPGAWSSPIRMDAKKSSLFSWTYRGPCLVWVLKHFVKFRFQVLALLSHLCPLAPTDLGPSGRGGWDPAGAVAMTGGRSARVGAWEWLGSPRQDQVPRLQQLLKTLGKVTHPTLLPTALLPPLPGPQWHPGKPQCSEAQLFGGVAGGKWRSNHPCEGSSWPTYVVLTPGK